MKEKEERQEVILVRKKMSDGITLACPTCGKFTALKKEYDELKVKLRRFSLKHPRDEDFYDSSIPVYTCSKCKKQWAIERVNL